MPAIPIRPRRRRAAIAAAGSALALGLLAAPASAEWATREGANGPEAGTLVNGAFAGVLFRCLTDGRAELRLTDNGARFDRAREHTLALSVDGTATLLPARAEPGAREGDDDFAHAAPRAALRPLLSALAGGQAVEIAAPSGRYTLPLAGSSRAIAAFREGCPGA